MPSHGRRGRGRGGVKGSGGGVSRSRSSTSSASDTGTGRGSDNDADGRIVFPPRSSYRATTGLEDLSRVKYEEKEAPYISDPSEMVTFVVGKDRKEFLIHKDRVCEHSEVLKVAFNGGFIEGMTNTYTLEDVNAETFNLFFHYLYFQELKLNSHNLDPTRDKYHIGAEDHLRKCGEQDRILAELWVLAEKFMVHELQNQVIGHMVRIGKVCVPASPDVYHFVYENTEEGSPLRRFLVEQAVWCSVDGLYADFSEKYPHEMLIDMVTCFRGAAPGYVRSKRGDAIDEMDYYVYEPEVSDVEG